MFTPKIIALDLDGTLFSGTGEVTPFTREQIRIAADKGITIVISTGRPFTGLPFEVAQELDIKYAITANGAGIYRIADKTCLKEDAIAPQDAAELCRLLNQKHLHLDGFIHGDVYTKSSSFHIIRHSRILPESVKNYILTTRNQVTDLAAFLTEHNLPLQKATLTFEQEADGVLIDREETKELLSRHPEVSVVCGGYQNLEFTKAGVTKGTGLRFLCDYLKIPIEASMACGDSENDLDILNAAGYSVAMENADESIRAICDDVTASNNQDGVGKAIAKLIQTCERRS